MSPFNLHGSNLKVETNVEGEVYDNDEWIGAKANLEHNIGNRNKPLLDGLPVLAEKPVQIEEDPALLAANDADLNRRGVATPKTRKPRTKKTQ
jgi:hypothetical protein